MAQQVSALLQAWFDVLESVAREAEARFGSLGPFSPADLAGLIGLSFLGGESVILLDQGDWAARSRSWLRSVATLIRQFEETLPPEAILSQPPTAAD